MQRPSIESLSPKERDCLRLVAPDRKSAIIAEMLGIAVPTVDAHIRSARQKLGGMGRFAAARVLHDWESSRSSTSQTFTILPATVEAQPPDQSPLSSAESKPLTLGDARIPFDHGAPSRTVRGGGEGRYDLNVINRIAMIAFCLLALVIVGIASIPLSDAIQRVARMVMTQRR